MHSTGTGSTRTGSASDPFVVTPIGFDIGEPELRKVRTTVFVDELGVPAELEADTLDPDCLHVIARTAAGEPIGTGRLVPPGLARAEGAARIGRLAVLADWRSHGVGAAMLQALLDMAKANHWPEVALSAQVTALDFYLRHGFIAFGDRFAEAGIEHQAMRRRLAGPIAIEDRETAVATTAALIQASRRGLWIYTRDLDPGLFDAPAVLEAMRRLATAGRQAQVCILLQDAAAPQRAQGPLLTLAQRLPTVFAFREIADPVDRPYPSAYVANDAGGFYFRTLGHRLDGEADLHAPGRARQLRGDFERVWERSRPVTEYRALGI